jgi:hypothetical protein
MRVTPRDCGDGSGFETVAASERSSFRRRLGLDVIKVDTGHLPAQRGKSQEGESGTGSGRTADHPAFTGASRDTLSIAAHRTPDQLDRAQNAQ